MSGNTSASKGDEPQLFKNKYQTEFMRVPQDELGYNRHPGNPAATLPRGPMFHVSGMPSSCFASSGVPEGDALPRTTSDFSTQMITDSTSVDDFGLTTLQKIITEQSGSREQPVTNCVTHDVRLSFWCHTCEEVACGECLFDKHPTDGHSLVKLQDVTKEIRETAITTIKVCHADATKIFSEHLRKFVVLLENLHHAGKLMQTARKLDAAAACAQNFSSVSSVYSAIKKINAEVVELKLDHEEQQEQEESDNESDEDSEETEDEEEKEDEDETNEPEEDKSEDEDLSNTEKKENDVTDEKEETKNLVIEIKEKNNKKIKKRKKSQVLVPRNPSEKSEVFAIHTDGRLAKIQTEGAGLHIYSLAQYPSNGFSVAVRLGLLMEFIQRENPVVFLDFSVSGEEIGRVYIELEGEMRRSVQFLHLCLGTLGPCYKGSRIDGIDEKGSPGEYLRMGDYTGQGGQGGVGLLEGLEWGSKWSQPKKRGQICGLGGDAGKRFGALFVVCTKGNPDDQFRCPFGNVVKGGDVLNKLCDLDPIQAAYVSNCGAVIPIDYN